MKIRRALVLAVLTGAIAATALGPTDATSGGAHRSEPGGPCVSTKELAAIERGSTRQHVTEQFGYKGVSIDYRKLGGLSDLDSSYREQEVRGYPGCRGAMGVLVGFQRRTVEGEPGAWRVLKVRSMAL